MIVTVVDMKIVAKHLRLYSSDYGDYVYINSRAYQEIMKEVDNLNKSNMFPYQPSHIMLGVHLRPTIQLAYPLVMGDGETYNIIEEAKKWVK